MKNDTIIVYTYRYIWKEKGTANLCVRFYTGTQEEHAKYQQAILDTENIISCLREYVSQVDFAYLGFTEEVKKEKVKEMEVNQNEES